MFLPKSSVRDTRVGSWAIDGTTALIKLRSSACRPKRHIDDVAGLQHDILSVAAIDRFQVTKFPSWPRCRALANNADAIGFRVRHQAAAHGDCARNGDAFFERNADGAALADYISRSASASKPRRPAARKDCFVCAVQSFVELVVV